MRNLNEMKRYLMMMMMMMVFLSEASERRRRRRREAPPPPSVSCSPRGMKAVFDPRVRDNVHVRDLSGASVPVLRSPGSCGVKKSREGNGSLSVVSRHDGCYSRSEGGKVSVPLLVQVDGNHGYGEEERWLPVNISCPMIKRRSERMQPVFTAPPPAAVPGTCSVEESLRLACGSADASEDDCYTLGCCYATTGCYYRLEACSVDGYFVFSVSSSLAPSLRLSVKNHPHCVATATNQHTAIFKIGVTECGVTRKTDGEKVIYEVEVEELQDGFPSLHPSFSLQVQCEYDASDLKRAAALRPLLVSPAPSPAVGMGTIGVQMRIATDSSFSSFVPEKLLPLTLPLQAVVHVEVSMVTPDASLSLRVRDCFASPASGRAAWTLMQNGCPNPLDDLRSSAPLGSHAPSQVRRFDVKTFAFMEPRTGRPSSEEVFFYCWVEVCPPDVDCVQSCSFSPSERRRRSAPSGPVQLLSVGPLVSNPPEPPRTPQNPPEPSRTLRPPQNTSRTLRRSRPLQNRK